MGYTLYLCARGYESGEAPGALAQRVEQALARRFGHSALVGGATPTAQALLAADMVIALLDAQWAQTLAPASTGLTGATVVAAAQEGKVILPLLLDDAAMPDAEDLPLGLRFLHYRNALRARGGAAFDSDMAAICDQIETTLRGRALGVQAGILTVLTGGWLALLMTLSLVFVGVLLTQPATILASGVFARLALFYSDAQRCSIIAFTPLVINSLYISLRLALWRRWGQATLLTLCAAAMAFQLTQPVTSAGLLYPWSQVAWAVALVSSSGLLIPAALVALLTLFTLAMRPSRLTYSNRALMSSYRNQRETALRQRDEVAPGLYIACRREDMSDAYQALCDSLERDYARFRSMSRPIYRSYTSPDARHLADWEALLQQSADVVVVMGPHWLDGGPDDPLREELALALRTGKMLIPVLLDGAEAPAPAEMPPELAPLCFMRPIRIAGRRDYQHGFTEVFGRALDVPSGYGETFAWLLDTAIFNYTPAVFISYRRADSAAMCDRIYRALSRRIELGRAVFRDTDAISAGVDFFAVLMSAIASSRVVIALIGPQWLSLADATGARRLDNPEDMVRKELATALEQKKVVLPVLLDGARMPTAAELPAELAALATRTPLRVSGGASFSRDVARLSEQARRSLGEQRRPLLALASVATLGLWIVAIGLYLSRQDATVAYLLGLAPQWRQELGSSVTLYALPTDATTVRLLVALALAASAATLWLSVVALFHMLQRRQWLELAPLALALLWIGALLLGIGAVARDLAPAWYTVASADGVASLIFTPIILARLIALPSALVCAGLALYFWRSRSEPRPTPA